MARDRDQERVPDLLRRRATRQQAAQQCLGLIAALVIDEIREGRQAACRRAVLPDDIRGIGLGPRRTAHLGAAHRGQALDDRKRAQRPLERRRHRQAVGQRGQGVVPPVFGPAGAVGHPGADHLGQRHPDRVQAHGVPGQAPGVHVAHGREQAREQLRRDLLRRGIGDVDVHPSLPDRGGIRPDVLPAEQASAVGDPELPVVPRAGQHVPADVAVFQRVALVRAPVVRCVHAGGRPEQRDPLLAMAPEPAVPVRDIRGGDGAHEICHGATVTPGASPAHRPLALGPCYPRSGLSRSRPARSGPSR